MPHILIQPYLFFGGRCREALDFYQHAIGAQVDMVMKFSQSPTPLQPGCVPDGFDDKIMHSSFRVGSNVIMASDGNTNGQAHDGYSLSINVQTPAEVDTIFNKLVEGGKVVMPAGKTFWSERYGMLTDKFGVNWMVGVMA